MAILAKNSIVVSLAFVILSPLVGWIIDKFGNQAMVYQLIIAIGAIVIATIILFFVEEKEEVKKNEEIKQIEVGKIVLTIAPFIFTGIMFLIFSFQAGGGFWALAHLVSSCGARWSPDLQTSGTPPGGRQRRASRPSRSCWDTRHRYLSRRSAVCPRAAPRKGSARRDGERGATGG